MLKHHRTRVQYQQYKGYTVATVAKLNVWSSHNIVVVC
jgi:hypothetical protein